MDVFLSELQEAEDQILCNRPTQQYEKEFIPEKRGSFVEDGEEFSTTNMFVANLSPSVTEEALTELFSQFGEIIIYIYRKSYFIVM